MLSERVLNNLIHAFLITSEISTLDYLVFGLCPSSGILKNTRFENSIRFRPQV
jgi:hypothetical protein